MAWDGPILTDSGGYQVVSLGDLRIVDEDGVTFRSHIDGSTTASPRSTRSRSRRRSLGRGGRLRPAGRAVVAARGRCRRHGPHPPLGGAPRRLRRTDQALFGIVQGGLDPELRAESTRFIASLPFDGICIGGLAGDETPEQRDATLDLAVPLLADDPSTLPHGARPRRDLLEAVHRGVDLFDSGPAGEVAAGSCGSRAAG